jgi:hypothetical protein
MPLLTGVTAKATVVARATTATPITTGLRLVDLTMPPGMAGRAIRRYTDREAIQE